LLSENALQIFKSLYSKENESVDETFKRVAKEFSTNEEEETIAFNLLKDNIWRPNTPVFFNAGKKPKDKVFAACYVVGLEDSMNGIYEVVNIARRIFQYGSGVGIPIGNLREKDAFIFEGDPDCDSPEGRSSGPVVFMRLFDSVGDTTKSGGRVRRAAILCSMEIDHPDIEEFIYSKRIDKTLSNMNISVSINDKFMKSLEDRVTFDLISPSTGEVTATINSQELWDKLVECSWESAEPGILFIDTINRYNPLKSIIQIQTPNPCGEQPLIPFGSCVLTAINVSKFVAEGGYFDFVSLENTAYTTIGLMDNLIDNMAFPDEKFKINSRKYRHLGLGIMGLSDAMFMLDIKYDSPEGKKFAGEIMKVVEKGSIRKSAMLAKEKGKFFNYDNVKEDVEDIVSKLVDNDPEVINLVRANGLRNVAHTTIAPTGTTALSCDCSYGLEQCFGLVFTKNLISGGTMHVVNPIFKERFENESWFTPDLLDKIAKNNGSLKNLRGIPKEVREVFVTAHDIKPKDRIDVQAEMQLYCSSAISSTINLPSSTTKEEISELYKYAYEKGLKGVTVYRDGCRKNQPITFKEEKVQKDFVRPTKLKSETIKVETGNGKLYATIGEHKGNVVEVLLSLGKGGKDMYAMSEALGRSISVGLQHGAPLQAYIKQLRNINSDKPVWTRLDEEDKRPIQILSVPDALAKVLERFYSVTKLDPKEFEIEEGKICPKCEANTLKSIEGCESCVSCGYTKCS
jgi:ribonucleoside-diphosphate reductase alpha chain